MKPQRVKPIMDAAIARFRMFQRMRTELAETKRALEERKMIDRAKGMLMKARGVGEDEAYALLRFQLTFCCFTSAPDKIQSTPPKPAKRIADCA